MKKILYFGVIIICLVIINNLVRSIYDLWHKQDLVVSAQKELDREKKENAKLKKLLGQVQSKEFIEEEARNKLFLVKPGESAVILPNTSKKAAVKIVESPNWQKWLDLFIGQ